MIFKQGNFEDKERIARKNAPVKGFFEADFTKFLPGLYQ
jgi:hypothetical protein